MRALIVDDDSAVAAMAARYLSAWGWDADACASASAARERFAPGTHRLALCDVDLPDGDGVGLAADLRAASPSLAVVVMSGSPAGLERAGAAGFRARLDKPFGASGLRAALELAGAGADGAGPYRVLLVEDDPLQSGEYAGAMESAGWEVVFAESAEKALRLVRVGRFDAVVLDNVLPGMSGLQALSRLRAAGPAVVMMSSSSGPEIETDALLLGAGVFMRKPFVPGELVGSVRKVCAGIRESKEEGI